MGTPQVGVSLRFLSSPLRVCRTPWLTQPVMSPFTDGETEAQTGEKNGHTARECQIPGVQVPQETTTVFALRNCPSPGVGPAPGQEGAAGGTLPPLSYLAVLLLPWDGLGQSPPFSEDGTKGASQVLLGEHSFRVL